MASRGWIGAVLALWGTWYFDRRFSGKAAVIELMQVDEKTPVQERLFTDLVAVVVVVGGILYSYRAPFL
jgi:predicted site-specific integrase-resolvase